jgi:c-di-GMP-binding flagellar brake protein YcgR
VNLPRNLHCSLMAGGVKGSLKLIKTYVTIRFAGKILYPGKKLVKAYARQYPRHDITVPVEYSVDEKFIRTTAKTLSGGGIFLTRVGGLEAGLEISLRFRPAKHLPFINAKGKVLYILPEKGAGVEFTEITQSDRHIVLRLILQKTGDRRVNPRAPLATQVQCDQCMSLAFSREISLGGMFIETTDLLPVGSALTVRFNLEQRNEIVSATARVTYQLEKMGFGVVFTELEQDDCEAIRHYLESQPPVPATYPGKSKTV